MSVIGFQKKVWMGWVDGLRSVDFCCWIFGICFNFAKPLKVTLNNRNVATLRHTPITVAENSCF